jgi:hypothetical protein
MRDLDPHQFAAVALVQFDEKCFRFQRHRVCNDPRTRREP